VPARIHKIIQVGPMLGISFPKTFVEEHKLKKGTQIRLEYSDGPEPSVRIFLLKKGKEPEKDPEKKEEETEKTAAVETA